MDGYHPTTLSLKSQKPGEHKAVLVEIESGIQPQKMTARKCVPICFFRVMNLRTQKNTLPSTKISG